MQTLRKVTNGESVAERRRRQARVCDDKATHRPRPQMGGTVFHHPASYSKISKRIRSNLAGAPGTVLVGVLLNHAYLPGVINRGPDSPPLPLPASPLGPLSGGWGPLLPFDQWPGALEIERALPAARELLQSDVDFLVGLGARAGGCGASGASRAA